MSACGDKNAIDGIWTVWLSCDCGMNRRLNEFTRKCFLYTAYNNMSCIISSKQLANK